MLQPIRPPNAGLNFVFNVGLSTDACPTFESTSKAHLYNIIEDDGGRKTERALSATEGPEPYLMGCLLDPLPKACATSGSARTEE
jgi:hypothetical protein